MKSLVHAVIAAAALSAPAALVAQTPAGPAPAPTPAPAAPPAGAPAAGRAAGQPADAVPLALERVAARLKPVGLTYQSSVTAGGQVQNAGTRTLRLVSTTQDGAPAWMLLDGQETPALKGVDTLVVRGRDLAAVRRATHVRLPEGEVLLTMRFTADSVVGTMRMGGQSQELAMRNAPNTAASDGVLLLALAGAPLANGYVGALSTLDPQTKTVRPLTMRVTGRERVTVPAGAFDAWVVRVTVGGEADPIGEATYYVADGGPVVRMVATSAQMGGAKLESVLQSASPPR